MGGSQLRVDREREDLLHTELCDAWFEYLAATRGQTGTRYAEVEPWAWKRLEGRLRAIKKKAKA